ncbi:MAG TPA: RluA family pseudouridine synthase [Candidatus Kapabacteria bacterium]|nr:RluA family pseudouridine synthase [Candidatus Kapabacteria bacterium]
MALQVLYEDNHLIAVYKPAGVLVQGDETGDPTLMDEVKYYLKTEYNKLGKVFLGLIHRLDRPVSGIILFAKTSKGASRLSEQFRLHTVEKIYHALVLGMPAVGKDTLVHYLKKDENKNIVAVVKKETPGSQYAELAYETVQTNGAYSIVKVILKTGRAHQIRAQLSAIGCPIVGDVKYGAPHAQPDRSLALCATSLSFTTATGEERKTISIDIPHAWRAMVQK